jgi:L-rhamnose isomerase
MDTKQAEILKDNTYYDQTGKQILVGDLLKVAHFYIGKRLQYMYHVAVMEETKDFPVMAVSAHYCIEPHCRMYACADKETRVYKNAKIIGTKDWETKRKRIKVQK